MGDGGYNLLKNRSPPQSVTSSILGALLTQESGFTTEAPGAGEKGGDIDGRYLSAPPKISHLRDPLEKLPSI